MPEGPLCDAVFVVFVGLGLELFFFFISYANANKIINIVNICCIFSQMYARI